MSYTYGVTPTATSPVTGARSIAPIPTNYNADWRVVKEGASEVVLSNIQAPLSNPETLRIAFSEVADVFKGTKIEPASSGFTETYKRGASVLIQLMGTASDESDPTNRYPWSANLVLKVPYGAEPLPTNIQTIVSRLLSHLYDTGDASVTDRVASLLRGSLTPTDV